jgi:hypothetical protein
MNAGRRPAEKKKIPLECGIADGEARTRTGNTTISVVRWQLSNDVEFLANSQDPSHALDGWEVRKFRSFLADSGDERRLVSQ